MSPDRCDVLIVGGGPAGSSCAWALRRAGLDVVVLDKSGFPRNKVCAGWITPPVLDALHIDRADYARDRVLQPITGFSIGRIGGMPLETEYSHVVSYGVRRCEFDHYLLQRSGARLRLDEPLRSIERRDGGWLVNQHIETPLLIGVLAGVLNFVPYFGSTVAFILALLLALNGSLFTIAGVAVVFGIEQFLEGHFFVPYFTGRQVELHPLAVLAALIVGANLAGILGALVAVPIAAGIDAVLQEAYVKPMERRHPG